MNDMLNNPIVEGDVVLYDGQVCKVVNSTKYAMKYVCGVPYGNGELSIRSTTMNTKVLKLNDFNPSKIDEMEVKLSSQARDFIKPSKRPLSVEEQTTAKVERDRRNKLKRDTKPFDIITTGHYDNLVYFGKFNTIPAGETEANDYHVYAYVGYAARNADLVDDIINRTHNRSFSLHYQKSKKQPTQVISRRNDELKQLFKTLEAVPGNGRNAYFTASYQTIRDLLKDV